MTIYINIIFKIFIVTSVATFYVMPVLAVEALESTAKAIQVDQMQNEIPADQIKAGEDIRKDWKNRIPEKNIEEHQDINERWQNIPSNKFEGGLHKRWEAMTPEQRAEKRREMREHWEKMPVEERRKMRKKMKEHWQNMSPIERESQRQRMRERWEKMSSEEREQLKLDISRQKRLTNPN